MRECEVRERAFSMPLTSPAFAPGPYRFVNREYLIITYRTDPARLRALVPEPLEIDERRPLVKYEFIRMPDSTGFGDYTESGQVIPVTFRGRAGSYSHCMFLNDGPPVAGGRELWGFPKKLASPSLRTEVDTLVGTLDYGPIRLATGSMGYKHRPADRAAVLASLQEPNFLLKIIPHVDGGTWPEKLVADAGYGSAENLAWLVHERGIEPHIPVFDKSQRRDGTFSRSDFAYDHKRDLYTCPGGKELRQFRRQFEEPRDGVDREGLMRYRASKLDCDSCSLKPQCCPTAPARKLLRSIHEGARDMARDIAATDAYVTSRRERKKVEMLFAHLKRILKLDRLRLRGPCGARDEFLLAATAQNLRKMAKLMPAGAQPQAA